MDQRHLPAPYVAPPDYSDDDALVMLVDAARVICSAPHTDTDPVVIRVRRVDLTVLQLAVADYTGQDTTDERMKGGST